MINVFKKHAPAYKRLVRNFALDIWKNRENEKKFWEAAERFKKRYERDLVEHYKTEGIRIYRGTIRAKADQWLEDQKNLVGSLKVIAEAKKDKLTVELFDSLRKEHSPEIQKKLNRYYLTAKDIERGASVYQVFSFSENLQDRAEQIGEEEAFALGRDINHSVVSTNSDRYEWDTQEDSRVRKTHRKLRRKTFLYVDPPTTIDKYGHSHTGHPGTDYGCRCYEIESKKKALRHYTVRE